jgi:FlaA1/EpsC-like NDP-sugar epimerase
VLSGKTVLVTGAGGSIGSVLCERIAKGGVRKLKGMNLTEGGLYHVTRRLKSLGFAVDFEPILGSVADRYLVRDILAGVDVVIHAAAHKHLPICQANPVEAIQNNVFGTETLLQECLLADTGQFVLVSSDKAVDPSSIMGATKRVAELIVQKAAKASPLTTLSIVRFGNVLDSAGSVLPLWREQIQNGGPITLTDPRCERYFMSIPDACDLILGVLELETGTFVLDMGKPVLLLDLATNLIASTGMECGIKYIGLRPGEKLTEKLYNGELSETLHPKIRRVRDEGLGAIHMLDELRSATACRATAEAVRLLGAIAA